MYLPLVGRHVQRTAVEKGTYHWLDDMYTQKVKSTFNYTNWGVGNQSMYDVHLQHAHRKEDMIASWFFLYSLVTLEYAFSYILRTIITMTILKTIIMVMIMIMIYILVPCAGWALGPSPARPAARDYRFIVSKLSGPRACGPRAYPSLARGYGPGLGLKLAGRAGPGPNIHGLGRAWAGPGPKF